jgi:ribonucleoside-diphosphate reductase alpha chain
MTIEEYNGITIDYSRDADLPEQGKVMLTKKGFYKKDYEDSPQQGFARAANCFSFGDKAFAQRMYDYMSKLWFTNASPVLSNAIDFTWPENLSFDEAAEWLEGNITPDGLPISCFLPDIPDTKEGLVSTAAEVKWLSMMGGGVGVYAGMRSPDEKSTGVMAHMKEYDAIALAYKQTESRRGSIAAYLDIDHPEIISFLEMRNPVGGEINKKCFNLNNGVNIPDSFMEAVIAGDTYPLIDPKHGDTGRELDAREVWEKLLELRKETGEPYIMWKDTVNRMLPEWITRPLYKVKQSNLCSEITLMTSKKRTAVCCLSSLNLEKYEEWKDTTIVEDLIRYLDNVLEYFIRLAPPELHRAVNSAKKERAIGLGTLGFHAYLQSKMISYQSGGLNSASHENHRLFNLIKTRAIAGSRQLAKERGEARDVEGSGMRNSHLLAVAPNASSSSIAGTSPSIELWSANAFNAQGRAGSFLIKNKYLEKYLEGVGKNTKEVWSSIIANEGSVYHLDFIPDDVKEVFATSKEVDPMWVIEHAGIRAPLVCQAVSNNLTVPSNITKQRMSDIHMKAWRKGVKTLYYCRSEEAMKASVGSSYESECLSCEG